MKRVVGLLMLALIVSAPLSANIRPDDQRLAQRLSLRPKDLGSDWRRVSPPSTEWRTTGCPTAPKMERYVTGFYDSAAFRLKGGVPDEASGTTRVWPSEAAARHWFRWAAGGGQARCILAGNMADWKDDGYRVSPLPLQRQRFRADCTIPCPPHSLVAWSTHFRAFKHFKSGVIVSGNFRVDEDWVVVRVGRAVIGFSFWEMHDKEFNEFLVGEVLQRAP